MNQTGLRYVGVLTDGTQWHCYDLVDGRLRQVSDLTLDRTDEDEDRLVVWLEGVLATTQGVPPTGDKFADAGIYGVVEADFFDWVLEVEGGEPFIRTLAKRLMRFVWSDVNQDILKILYENFIGRETRKRLGEYYTPDWLAEVMVAETIKDPLKTRVLDPACGSGTFLFHAVKRYIAAAEAAGHGIAKLLTGVTRHVVGMDLHPVAVTLARVTYILAIGRHKLTHPKRGDIQIPRYLGDSFQWREQNVDLFSAGNLVIRTE